MKQFNNASHLRFAQGITLVELLIGIAILAFISLMVASVYVAHFRLFSNQSTNIDVASQNRIALDEMVNQIRESTDVWPNGNSSGCGFVFSGTDQIVLRLWPLDPITGDPTTPSDINDNTTYDHVYYCIASGNLYKAIQPALGSKRTQSQKILATNVSQLAFTYYDSSNPPVVVDPFFATQIKVQLKISQQNYDKKQTFETDQTGKAVLRNKPN